MYDLYQIMFSQLIDKQFMQLSFFNGCFGSFYIYPVKKIHLVTTTEYAFTFQAEQYSTDHFQDDVSYVVTLILYSIMETQNILSLKNVQKYRNPKQQLGFHFPHADVFLLLNFSLCILIYLFYLISSDTSTLAFYF